MPETRIPEVPFEQVFTIPEGVECRSHARGLQLAKRFTGRRYQFEDCTLTMTTEVELHLLEVEVEAGPEHASRPWRADWAGDPAEPNRISISVRQTRDADIGWGADWSEAPLVLRFRFQDGAAVLSDARLTLSPASEADLIELSPPHLPTRFLTVWGGDRRVPLERFPSRIDVQGTPVFRLEEPIYFEVSYALADGVTATEIGALWQVAFDPGLEGHNCDGWNLALTSFDPAKRPDSVFSSFDLAQACLWRSEPTRLSGTMWFDARLGGAPRSSRFEMRFTGSFEADVAAEIDRDGSELRELRVVNLADYPLPVARIRLDAGCVANPDVREAVDLVVPAEPSSGAPVVEHAGLPIGGGARFSRAVIQAAAGALETACPEGRWQVGELRVYEATPGIAEHVAPISFDPFVIEASPSP